MFRLHRLSLLLALLFVTGQCLALLHAERHELGHPAKAPRCELCAVAHSGGGLPSRPLVFQPLAPAVEVARAPAPERPAAGFRHQNQPRGPPLLNS